MAVRPDLPYWRSMLYVPANNERFLAKAHQRGADAIILDLEDSVPPAAKSEARRQCSAAIEDLLARGQELIIRINAPLRHAVRDLEAMIVPGIRAIMFPKTQSANHVRLISELIGELEGEGGISAGAIGLMPVIESAAAYFQAENIARADPRVIGLLLGSEDFATDTSMVPAPEPLRLAKQQIVIAAASAGIRAYGLLGTVADYGDSEKLKTVIHRSAEFGFAGATCIHPSVVPVLNDGFSPCEAQISEAQEIIAALEAAEAEGIGAVSRHGRMIDAPVAERARDLLRRAKAFSER